MYPRAMRNLLSFSPKLKDLKTLRNSTLTFPVISVVQKLLPCNGYHCSVQNFSFENSYEIPKDPKERKLSIEEDAQRRIEALKAKDPDFEKQIKLREMEFEVWRQAGHRIPSKLRSRDWYELLKLDNPSRRKKFLDYLYILEIKQEKRRQKSIDASLMLEEAREKRKYEKEQRGANELVYAIGENCLLRRITPGVQKVFWQWNNLRSIMYGNKIIFDLSYEKYMNSKEMKSCARQLMECYAVNRIHNYAFDVYFCNVDFSGELFEKISRYLPNILDDDFPWTITSKSYLELFDKSQLVYLSGHAQKTLETYNPDSIYILGAFVDQTVKKPISLEKAKEQKLQIAKLPIDHYIHLGSGSNKNLTINQVTAILLDFQETNNWNNALKHVPRRKLYENRIISLEKKIQRDMGQNPDDSDYTEKINKKIPLLSRRVTDFSHVARARHRSQWEK